MSMETRLNLRFKDDKTVNALTLLAKKNDVSLNQFACDILGKYVKCSDKYVLDALPMIVKSMVSEEIKNVHLLSDEVLKNIYITLIKLRKVTETMTTFLIPEFNEAEYDSIKTEELCKLLSAMDIEE